MSSEETLRDFLLQNRSIIIWVVSIAFGVVVFGITRRKLYKSKLANFPTILSGLLLQLSNWNLTLSHSRGPNITAIRAIVVFLLALLNGITQWWTKLLFAIGAVLAVLAMFVFKYVADAGTKAKIEADMTLPGPLCTRTTRDSVLLFIHGWYGDANETWQQFPRLACDDPRLSRTDVISIGYPTYMRKSGYTVVETSVWIYQELVAQRVLRESDKVVVIAHSMGGLIAREMALKAPTSKIQLHIVGITTISSPHNGADIGTLADALGVSSHYTSDMKHGSHTLASLHARWNDTDQKYRPRLVCFGGIIDHVVKTDSAFFQCDEQYKIQQWGHSELVKPTSRDDERYRRPMDHVVKALMM